MEHYLTQIEINKLRHLSNITINLSDNERKHLLITGKNGSGKTTVLLEICKYLKAISEGNLKKLKVDYKKYLSSSDKALKNIKSEEEKFEKQNAFEHWSNVVKKYSDGLEIHFNKYEDLDAAYKEGNFVISYFSADRKTKIVRPKGVENVKLQEFYPLDAEPGTILLKYMVHLKTQQSYARNEGNNKDVERIQKWFDRFENALKVLFDDENIKLEYNYKEYEFRIIEKGKEPFGFDQLSDGYSSLIHIISDLILRMDKNWILKEELSEYNVEGIVLIDELETHLHIELQKKILPFLTKFFPRIQFVVTTHSPYILNSVSNAKAYDLEKQVELENMFVYSSEDLAEAYFNTDQYSDDLKIKLKKYEELVKKENLSEEERALRAELRFEFSNLSREMTNEINMMFHDIETRRKLHG